MEYTVEKLSGNKVKISFKAPAADFEAACEKAYLKNRGRINVPGFRKGKAPRKLIENMYGDMIFYDDALEMIFPEAYMDAVQKEDLHPVSRPDVNVDKVEKGQDVEFTCEVYVQPEVKLGEYRGIEVARVSHPVTDEEVNERIAQEQKRVARSVEVTDRAVENGDDVNLDYSGSVDGVKFAGGTAEKQNLVIGSNSFIPGFEEQMIGMNIGEEKDLNVKFPDEYHAEELKGKDAVFHVKVNSISREELPEIDDDFASEISDFDTLAEYTADLKKKMQETNDAQSTEAAKQSLIQKVVENAEVDVPDPMVEEKVDEMLEEMNWRMQQQGFDMKKYLQLTGQTEEQMRAMYREEAKNNVKTELVINEIIKAEKLEAEDKDVDALLEEYTKPMNKTIDELKKEFNESQMGYFQQRAKVTKALDMLWDAAKVTDEAPKAEKAPKTAKASKTEKAAKSEKTETETEEKVKKPAAKKTAAKKAKADEQPEENA